MSMKRTLWQHLRQSKPFENVEEEVFLQILYTAQITGRWVVEALRPFSLTSPQYNVLRILRGAHPGALPAGKIAERMIHHDPDVTRLLDKLEGMGLVEKARDDQDRRVINVRITKEGMAVLEKATRVMREALDSRLGPVGPKRLAALAELLEVVRAAAETSDRPDGAAPAKPERNATFRRSK
ncbi:MAG TPA: MarR family transcriptional regulator [Acidobacteriota bacterium]|nr:MarR family transcriptional regulator [Acidobacteriota bacterium]